MTPRSSPLVSAEHLAAWLDSSGPGHGPVLLDVRWRLGADPQALRAEYESGHLPGAAWVDLESELSDPVTADGAGGRHPMPSRERFQEAMRRHGVRNDRPVVVYDGATSLGASRAWWLLRYFGKDDAVVLDGGVRAWVAAGRPVETGSPTTAPGDFVATPGARPLLGADDARHYGEGAGGHVLLDARPTDRFRGENETIDPVAGHIPGAVSCPALSNLAPDGRFLPPDELAARLRADGVGADRHAGIYCGSGVQATHLALAIELADLGEHPPAVYIGSWSDWITDPDRPTA